MLKKILRGLVVLAVILAGLAVWKREDLIRLNSVNTLFSEEKIVHNFSHMGDLFHNRPIPITSDPIPLPTGDPMPLPSDWDTWLARRSITGILVVHDGAIRHESYHRGTDASDPRISWSVAKSYLSALFGVVLANGDIASLDDPVTKYAPSLRGSAYDNASILNVLQMSSGVTFDEDYLDFWSDINKMGRILALGGSMDGFVAGLTETFVEPGEQWKYVSIDTHVLGMVLRGATGRNVPDLLGEYVLSPLGTYGTPHYVTDGDGVSFVLGGLNLTTRDYARMGEMFRNDGLFQGQQIIPKDWVEISTKPSAKTEPGKMQYGYQWWMPADAKPGEFLARGVYGQYVYVDKTADVVIAVNAADRAFREAGANDDSITMFRRLAAQLKETGS